MANYETWILISVVTIFYTDKWKYEENDWFVDFFRSEKGVKKRRLKPTFWIKISIYEKITTYFVHGGKNT